MKYTSKWAGIALAVLASFPLSIFGQQTSDAIFRHQMEEYGIKFTEGNRVKLL